MAEHYFSADPLATHDEVEFTARLRGMDLRFVTDRGVFSRERVDAGSRLLIESFQVGPGDTVLDLGCGYGPLGIVAARLAPRGRVYLVDVNGRAAALARRNLVNNQIGNAEVRVGDGTAPVRDIAFDTVLFNPPVRAGKAVVWRLLDEAHAALKPGGSLWVVIGNKQGAPSVRKRLEAIFTQVEDVERGGGFRIYRAVKGP